MDFDRPWGDQAGHLSFRGVSVALRFYFQEGNSEVRQVIGLKIAGPAKKGPILHPVRNFGPPPLVKKPPDGQGRRIHPGWGRPAMPFRLPRFCQNRAGFRGEIALPRFCFRIRELSRTTFRHALRHRGPRGGKRGGGRRGNWPCWLAPHAFGRRGIPFRRGTGPLEQPKVAGGASVHDHPLSQWDAALCRPLRGP